MSNEPPASDQTEAERPTPTNVEKLKGLPWGVAWGVTNSIGVKYTFFGSMFVLYLSALGLDKGQIGGLLSLLPFLGIVAIFIAPAVARAGTKRTFVIAHTGRAALTILLMLIPWVLTQFGVGAATTFTVLAVGSFGLVRAIGLTAFYPWQQEQVPDSMRGKFSALKNTLASLAALVAVLVGGVILGPDPGLDRFVIIIGVGVLFGFVSAWTATKIPGGAPDKRASTQQGAYRDMLNAAKDTNLVRYLIGASLVIVATVPMFSFVPLFMVEEVGLSSDQVVWLEMGVLLGGLATAYLWGWLADRYGSKPVMASGVLLLPVMPLAWLLMPRGMALSLYLALGIALLQGLINTGWTLGSGRLLFVGIVPDKKRTAYMALYYAWMGIVGGLAQLMGGWLLELTAGVSGQWWIITLDQYTILFVLGTVLPFVSYALFTRVRADSDVSTAQFAGMFVRGNPFAALGNLLRYRMARDERAAVESTERLGSSKSPLTDEELLEALQDPRFYVRYEAIVSIARHGADDRLTEALILVLEAKSPALSTLAAWALGRTGGERAIEALRQGLDGRYRSVQAHCARSLGTLGDESVAPVLLERLAKEPDVGLQLAFGSALGKLGTTEAVDLLLNLLRDSRDEDTRGEFSLALARLVGDEHDYIRLQRRVRDEPGTALSQAVSGLDDKLEKEGDLGTDVSASLKAAADLLAQDSLEDGIAALLQPLELLLPETAAAACEKLVTECVSQLEKDGLAREEYAVLLLHAFDCATAE